MAESEFWQAIATPSRAKFLTSIHFADPAGQASPVGETRLTCYRTEKTDASLGGVPDGVDYLVFPAIVRH